MSDDHLIALAESAIADALDTYWASVERARAEVSGAMGPERSLARDHVRICIGLYARECHRQQIPPERMLVRFKTLLREQLAVESRHRRFAELAVSWAISAYFERSESP